MINIITKYQLFILFGLAFFVLFFNLGKAPIYILDEARNAQCAREMSLANEWIVPTFNGELRGHKPPLHYYFMYVAYKVFGYTPFAARFFSALMGLLTLVITYYFTKKYINRSTALWATIVLLLSSHFLFEFRLSVPDPYLIFFSALGTFLFWGYLTNSSNRYLFFSAIAFGLGALAKGPIALAFPAISFFIWLVYKKLFFKTINLNFIFFCLLVLATAVPWFVLVHIKTNGAFTTDFFLTHNLERFKDPMEGHGGLFILVPLFIIIGLLPFSVLLIAALKNLLKKSTNPFILFCIIYVVVIITICSISGTKLPNYPMPCYPFLAIIIGHYVSNFINSKKQLPAYYFYILIVLNILLVAGVLFALNTEKDLVAFNKFGLVFMLLPLTTIVTFYFFKKQLFQYALIVFVVGYFLFNVLFLGVTYPKVYSQNPVTLNRSLLTPNKEIVAYKIYNPAFNFYTANKITVLNSTTEIQKQMANNPNLLIITRANLLAEIDTLPLKVVAKNRDLFETPTTVILQAK